MPNTTAEESGVPTTYVGPVKWKFPSQFGYKVNWDVVIDSMRREKKLSKQPWLELGCCKNLLASGPFGFYSGDRGASIE
jgi:hypothetical protein